MMFSSSDYSTTSESDARRVIRENEVRGACVVAVNDSQVRGFAIMVPEPGGYGFLSKKEIERFSNAKRKSTKQEKQETEDDDLRDGRRRENDGCN